MENGEVRADFHLHVYTSFADYEMEIGPRDAYSLTKGFMKKGLDVATITDFRSNSFDELIQSLDDIPKDWNVKSWSPRGFILQTDEDKEFGWIRTDEKPTAEGHILIIGGESSRDIPHGLSLEDTLGLAKRKAPIVVADHPFMVLKDPKNSGIGLENLEKYLDQFDAIEMNGNCIPFVFPPLSGRLNRRTLEYGEELGVPVLANSDAYGVFIPKIPFPGNWNKFMSVGRSYNAFDGNDVDFSTIDGLLESLRSAIKDNNFEAHSKGNRWSSTYNHGFFSVGYNLLKKIEKRTDRTLVRHHGDSDN